MSMAPACFEAPVVPGAGHWVQKEQHGLTASLLPESLRRAGEENLR